MLNATQTMCWLAEQLGNSFDMTHKKLQVDEKTAVLLFVKTVVDGMQLQQNIIKPFFEMPTEQHYNAYLQSLPNQQEITSREQILLELTKGSVVVMIQGSLLMFDVKKVNTNSVLQTSVETTIQGPQTSLSEDIQTNLNLIRQRYHQPSLSIEMFEVGTKSHQSLAVLYDQELVNQAVLEDIKKRIENLGEPIVQSTGELGRMMNGKKYSLFPTMMVTERTDRIIYNLTGGKIILLLDGNPFAIMAPSIFYDFMNSMEDNYRSYWITKSTKMLRYIGLLISLILPGTYVAITSFNPEIFRVQLALSVAGSRVGVPYPSYLEVLFMLLIMELLIEASIRLPKSISGTATTVGGLILGTAATEAALASNIMIIIVSAVAISNFAIPINEMSFAIRVTKYLLLFFAAVSGIAGLILSFIGFIMYLTHMNSFGEPYFKLFLQKKPDENRGMSR